jgi:xanthine dehydrogenase accessory factor
MARQPFDHVRTAIRGGGDLGSGVAYRLCRAGFPVLIAEIAHPLLVRRAVAYGSAAVEGAITVGGITARRVETIPEALAAQSQGEVAVIVDPEGRTLPEYDPAVLIDARMLKADPGPHPVEPLLVIGLGPGFIAPDNCDVVIETNRGHNLGRVIEQGAPEPNTGSPVEGIVSGLEPIGTVLRAGQPVARVADQTVAAPFDGVLRGLVHDGLHVPAGMKIGDVDPRAAPEYCFTISEKALAIGGGALEAILASPAIRERL